MIHLTETGFHAGSPYCSVNRAAAQEQGHRFVHPPYSRIIEFMNRPDICLDCKAIWNEEGTPPKKD